MSQKYLGKQAIGLIAERAVLELFPDAKFQVYVRHKILFVKVKGVGDFQKDWNFRIELFKRKKEILDFVNEKLNNFGYEVCMKELIIKWGRGEMVNS